MAIFSNPLYATYSVYVRNASISRIRGKETPGGIATNFCKSVDIHDVMTSATFCDDRLGVWAWQGVEFPVFPLTCVVDLTTLSHATTVRVRDQ